LLPAVEKVKYLNLLVVTNFCDVSFFVESNNIFG